MSSTLAIGFLLSKLGSIIKRIWSHCCPHWWKSKPEQILSWKLSGELMFHHCGGVEGSLPWNQLDDCLEDNENDSGPEISERPLLLLFGWLHATSKQIEKYRQFWYQFGFDVLTVRTSSASDILWPTMGAKKKGELLLQLLLRIKPRYNQILIHTFSIGAFQSMEFRKALEEWPNDTVQTMAIERSICAQIFDSTAFMEMLDRSFSIAVAQNLLKRFIIRYCFKIHLMVVNWITSYHYADIQKFGIANKHQVPALFLYSKDDPISDYRLNENLFQLWSNRNIFIQAKCWDRSSHVQHYRNHPHEYRELVNRFLEDLSTKLKKQIKI